MLRSRSRGAAENGPPARDVRLFRRFLFTSLAALVAIVLVAGYGQRRLFRELSVRNAERVAGQIGEALREIAVERFLQRGPLGARGLYLPEDEARLLDRQLKSFLSAFHVLELQVLSNDGIIVYATDPRLIGQPSAAAGHPSLARRTRPVGRLERDVDIRDLAGNGIRDAAVITTRVPVSDSSNDPLGAFVIQTDATAELATADRFIVLASAVLCCVVLVVFAALASLMYLSEQGLRHARAEAIRANEAKSQFLANMSHELRSPLHGVLGMTNLLRQTRLDDEQSEYVDSLKSSSESLLSVINDILDFSKIEAGKLDLEIRDVALASCLEDLMDVYGLPAREKGVDLVFAIDPCLPRTIRGDVGRIKQVLGNLLDNAIKFTESGRILLDARYVQGQGLLDISVVDTGIGIGPETLPTLFEPFTQADTSTCRRFGGSGLGLSISRQLAHMMGGSLSVESRQGEGSTFRFRLPVAFAEVDAAGTPVERRWLEGTPVLVACPNPERRAALKATLESWGARCETASSVSEVIRELRESASSGDPCRVALLSPDLADGEGGLGWRLAEDRTLGTPALLGIVPLGWRAREGGPQSDRYEATVTRPVKPSALRAALARVLHSRGEQQDAHGTEGATKDADRSGAGSRRVLIVEDNPVNQKVAEGLLGHLGYSTETASGGREALRMLETRSYDAILMDIQMPEMDGVQTTRRLRSQEHGRARRTPVIAMTAHAMKGDRERFLASGMDGYVSKPVGPEELARALVTVIEAADRGNRGSPSAQIPSLGYLEELAEGDRSLLRGLAEEALGESKRLLEELQAAWDREDTRSFARMAHDLKSIVGYLSQGPIRSLAVDLERLGREARLDQARPALARLSTELDALGRDIRGMVEDA